MRLVSRVTFLLLLLLTGCADSGSRNHPTNSPTDVRVRTLTLQCPPDSRPYEIDWLSESLEAHLKVLDKHRHSSVKGQAYYPLRIVVHRNKQEIQAAHLAAIQMPDRTLLVTPTYTSWIWQGHQNAPLVFFAGGALHCVVGDKLTLPGMSHVLWHHYERYDLSDHSDPRFPGVDVDCLVTQITLGVNR